MKVNNAGSVCETLIKITTILLAMQGQDVATSGVDLTEIVKYFNRQFQIEFNLFVNLNSDFNESFHEIVHQTDVPKLLVSRPTFLEIQNLYKIFNMRVLTVAGVEAKQFNATLNLLDGLLWKRHFTHIIFDWKGQLTADLQHKFFSECWAKGFTKVIVRHENGRLLTYSAFPWVRVRELPGLGDYKAFWHWDNLQWYEVFIPVVQFPPRCFSYSNRKGQLMVSGYFYKLIQTFIEHYNGSIKHDFRDIWKNGTVADRDRVVAKQRYGFLTLHMTDRESYAVSDSFGLCNERLIVPTGTEIAQSLYLLIPFNVHLWLMVLAVFLAMIVFFFFIQFCRNQKPDITGSIEKSIKVLLFISVEDFDQRTVFNFFLHLMFLVTGLFVTNVYGGNLYSLYTSRIYTPDMASLNDVASTNLKIYTYSVDVNIFRNASVPPMILDHIKTGNNTEFQIFRQRLNMTYIYYGYDDVRQFLLFQQQFLKRRIAKELSVSLTQNIYAIIMPNRTPFIERFNMYLGCIQDSGILQKLMADSQWDGVNSGILQLFKDDEIDRALSLAFFQYGFTVWLVGLVGALVVFLYELAQRRRQKIVITV